MNAKTPGSFNVAAASGLCDLALRIACRTAKCKPSCDDCHTASSLVVVEVVVTVVAVVAVVAVVVK